MRYFPVSQFTVSRVFFDTHALHEPDAKVLFRKRRSCHLRVSRCSCSRRISVMSRALCGSSLSSLWRRSRRLLCASLTELFKRLAKALVLRRLERFLDRLAITAQIDGVHDRERAAGSPQESKAESKHHGGTEITHRSRPSLRLQQNQSRCTQTHIRKVAFFLRKSHLALLFSGHCYSDSALA